MPTIATPLDERMVGGDAPTERPVARPAFQPTSYLTRERPAVALMGRTLLAAIFLLSGVMKLVNGDETLAHMQAAGIPYAEPLRLVAALAEILGGLSILIGFHARTGAAGLILFLIPTTIFFHGFWALEGQEAKMQMVNFMKNLTIMGGLAILAAMGPGRYSIDVARSLRPRSRAFI